MADNFKAEDMDGEYFPHVRVREDKRAIIVVNESPEETMEGAQRLARLFAAAPKLLEACQVARELYSSDSASADPEEILAMLDAAIKAALGEEV